MILLNVLGVTKHYGPDPVLSGVSFEVRPGERIGLVGPNGAGKTTLLKILAGSEEPDGGSVSLHSSARLGLLEQQPDFDPALTVWDIASSGLAHLADLTRELERVSTALAAEQDPEDQQRLALRYERLHHQIEHQDAFTLDHRIERVLHGLGFFDAQFRQSAATLSGGQQNRLILARLLLSAPDVVLLDEPSNHLDIEATEWLESFLAESDQAMLVVSHDRYFLDKVTNRTLELFDCTVESYVGNFTAYWRQKADRLEVQRRTFERQQEEIEKLEDFIRRNHYGQKATQAEDRRKKLERIERVARPREIGSPPMRFPPATRTGDIVLRAEHLTKGFVEGRPLFRDLSFQVQRGERWGILGKNGTGKTTLLRCLAGDLKPDEGDVHLGSGVYLGYFDQSLKSVPDDAQVSDAVRSPRKETIERERRDLLAKFGIQGDAAFQKVGSLSGGERTRTALARLAALEANVLVLDEPTNHLDLWARDSLERALKDFDGTVIFVSHDRYFLNRVADHLLVVERDRFREIGGNYDTYLHLVQAGLALGDRTARVGGAAAEPKGSDRSATEGSDGAAASSSSAGRKTKPKRRFPYRKVGDLERDIAETEARIKLLTVSLATPEVYSTGRVREVQTEIDSQRTALAVLYEHWEEAMELNS